MDQAMPPHEAGATATPSKSRSFSDPPALPATLAPSPTFRERIRQGSKDDHAVPTTPRTRSNVSPTSRRPDFLARGLSLQVPASLGMPSPAHFQQAAAPLSPKLDERDIYMQSQTLSASPATSLPRHSRGLDYTRACTTLHHSTTAEQSSPDSSPVITQKALGMPIPTRKGSVSSMMLDSPNVNGPGSMPWTSLAPERSIVGSSVGSINMLASDSENSESDEDASMGGDDQEDPIFTTPHVQKLQNPSAATPFTGPQTPGGAAAWGSGAHFSPAQASLMRTIRRTRLPRTGRRSRKSSSSADNSGYSSLASPRTGSPPPIRSIEGGAAAVNGGYFPWQTNAAKSRRESLAMGTDGLHLSSGNDSGDEASLTTPSTPGVVRRPVTRRGNLLPKTKGFARIRAALMEEAAPVDTEIRRESETIKQVRERDNSAPDLDLEAPRPGTATGASSPSLLPAVPESAQEDFGRDLDSDLSSGNKGLGIGVNFAAHASRNSGGVGYWNRFDPSMRTPPPPPSFPRQGSSGLISDMHLDSPAPAFVLGGPLPSYRRPRARSSASDASDAFTAPAPPSTNSAIASSGMNDDVAIRKFKRRRDDDTDIATIKRRAVSPGLSAGNSPVLTQSPSLRNGSGEGSAWGQPPEWKKESNGVVASSADQSHGSLQAVRSSSGGSTTGLPASGLIGQGKKLGLQGMKRAYSAITVQVDRLCSEQYEEDDVGGIIDLVEVVRIQASGPTEAARALRKKLKYGGPHQQIRALVILDGLIQNAGARFQRAFADEPLLERLRLMAREDMVDPAVRKKCQVLFMQWANAYKSTAGLEPIANLYKELPRTQRPAAARSKVLRESEPHDSGDDHDSPFESHGRLPASPNRSRASSSAQVPTTNSKPSRPVTLTPTSSGFYASKLAKGKSKFGGSGKSGAAPFNLAKEKEHMTTCIARASIASTNLLNGLQLINRETERVSQNVEVLNRFETCKTLRRQILLYIQQVESDEWIGSLVNANDELVKALTAYEIMDRSIDDDSDSDVDVSAALHASRHTRNVSADTQQALAGLDLGSAAPPPAKPPRPAAPSNIAMPAKPSFAAEQDAGEDEDDPFGDGHAAPTPARERAGMTWREV
ncbi:hypothetical protein LTR53_002648 [Teratosphaeriaceae sp. CCFEE 6253]|nr:hypothetical protein LTR53_002648 [Teratosphaeriaceae sp. CCFEE 6253]